MHLQEILSFKWMCISVERKREREKEGGEVKQANERESEREREAAHECNRAAEERRERQGGLGVTVIPSQAACEMPGLLQRDCRFFSFFFLSSAFCHIERFFLSSVSEVTSL